MLCSSIYLSGQTYSSLWKQVEKAIVDDLPKTALEKTGAIRSKALKEGNEGQELRATLVAQSLYNDLSPDSAKQHLDKMLRRRKEKAGTATAEVPLLWDMALSLIYRTEYHDTAASNNSVRLLEQTLLPRHLDTLRRSDAPDYAPLWNKGKDSRHFNDDLLSIFAIHYLSRNDIPQAQRRATAERLINYYRKDNNRPAALLLTITAATNVYDHFTATPEKNEAVRMLRDAMRQYSDLPLCVEAYAALTDIWKWYDRPEHHEEIMTTAREGLQRYGGEKRAAQLRNFIAMQEQPSLHVAINDNLQLPGKDAEVAIESKNMENVSLHLTRLRLTALQASRNLRKLRSYAEGKTMRHDFARPLAPHHRKTTDTVRIAMPAEPGVYLVEAYGDGRRYDEAVLHVSNVRPILFPLPDGTMRVTLVDGNSGHPLKEGTLTETARDGVQLRKLPVDADGSILLRKTDNAEYFAATPGDDFSRGFRAYAYYFDNGTERRNTFLRLFTDRAIYRPGQDISVSALLHRCSGDAFSVVPGTKIKISLTNANQKEIGTATLLTDSFGTASGRFTLPQECLPGTFCLRATVGGVVSTQCVKVEEYKRPGFALTVESDEHTYAPGDTADICVTARTYSGVPVAGAKVTWNTGRRTWWRSTGRPEDRTAGQGITDAEGRCHIPVTIDCATENQDDKRPAAFFFTTEIDVTASSGETITASHTLYAGNRTTQLTAEWPEAICREALPELKILQRSMGGKELTATGRYTITRNGTCAKGEYTTGQPFPAHVLEGLASGAYVLTFHTANDSLKQSFTLFSESDTRPADRTSHLWHYSRTSADGSEVTLFAGTPCNDAVLFVDMVGSNGKTSSRRIALSDTIRRFTLRYLPEAGEAQRIHFALMRGGKLSHFSEYVARPVPDKRLLLKWTTFRSVLTPGSTEEWQLRVTLPDGRPANAAVMARLYDASLDAFGDNAWRAPGVNFLRPKLFPTWSETYGHRIGLYGWKEVKTIPVPGLRFTEFDSRLFSYSRIRVGGARRHYSIKSRAANDEMLAEVAMDRTAPKAALAAGKQEAESAANEAETAVAETMEAGQADEAEMRTNFAETAFFMPALRTDADGTAHLSFTLPQSLTTWRFTALAHTTDMNYGMMDSTITARKLLMVQPALPRFVRSGDRASLPATVHNLSDTTVEAEVALSLLKPETEAVVTAQKRRISLKPGESRAVAFDFAATGGDDLLICRFTATGNGHTDGEEHYLPVLADRTLVTRTLPFTLRHAGRETLRIDTLFAATAKHRRLTVEAASNPAWYAVAALPVLAETPCHNAIAWATRLYALTLGRGVARQHPDIRRAVAEARQEDNSPLARMAAEAQRDETPWVAEAERETRRIAALKTLFDEDITDARVHSAVDNLRALQNSDGSWSWYKGMRGNEFITAETAILLARIERLANDKTGHDLMTRAFDFLKGCAKKAVKEIKETERRTGRRVRTSEAQMRYLYLRALIGLQPDSDSRFLTERAAEGTAQHSMYGKARMAVILAAAGQHEKARVMAKGLLEHTVATEDMGRYFDTERAQRSLLSYRIPTQVAAIEALQETATASAQQLGEMRLWLMQSKRTQLWEDERTTAEAVYALLTDNTGKGTAVSLAQRPSVLFTLYKGKDAVGANTAAHAKAPLTLGLVHESYSDDQAAGADRITLNNDAPAPAWGSIRASFSLPVAEVKAAAEGLAVARRFEVKRGTEWVPLRAGEALKQGERVRQVFTIRAERDFDFVSLRSARPACLEPVEPLSGYSAKGGLGAYRVVRDASTDFFFERMEKGTHVFTEETFADRAGVYECGISTVGCVYAPEFGGHTEGYTLRVE